MLRAEIISVGTELLLGDIVNTNAQFLSRELASLGFSVFHQSVVGDNPARLAKTVQEAKDRSDVIVLSGGLGPTADDLTKETVAEVFGDQLDEDPAVLAALEGFFNSLGRPMTPNNRKQAMRPRRGGLFANPNGTAPGAYFRQGAKYAILLPGPPREMEPMFLNEVRPLLETLQDSSIRSRTLRVFGIGESELETKVAQLLEGMNPTAALYAKTGEVHVRITAKAQNAGQADMMCAEYAAMFRRILGDLVYSEDGANLEETAVRTLLENGDTVALAESCTGGLLGQRLTSVPGASGVFGFGAVTYSNDVKHQLLGVRGGTLKKYGAVSSQTAAEMAFGAKKRGHADYGVAITGIAGPDGGTPEKPVGLVYVAVASGSHVYVRKLLIKDRPRDYVREMATQHALDMLRRVAAALPMPGAKLFTRYQQADFERMGPPRLHGAAFARMALALLFVAAVFGAVVLGIYLTRGGGAAASGGAYPSDMGYTYGTEEYTRAANSLVQRQKEQNPSVVGFVAMPGAFVEQMVAATPLPQPEIEAQLGMAGLDDMALISAEADPGVPMTNALVLAKEGMAQLSRFLDAKNAGSLTTFTYYTEHYAMEYRIYALYIVDQYDTQPDGFDAQASNLSGYTDYMTYIIGAKARSMYDIPVPVAQSDSYMTLSTPDPSVPGRHIYLCGRLAHAGEPEAEKKAAPAGAPIYPNAYYSATGAERPDEKAVYNGWMRWFLQGDIENEELVYRAGMPETDQPRPSVEPVNRLGPQKTPEELYTPPAETAEPTLDDVQATPEAPSGSSSSVDASNAGSDSSDTDAASNTSNAAGENANSAAASDSTTGSSGSSAASGSGDAGANASAADTDASDSDSQSAADNSGAALQVAPTVTDETTNPGEAESAADAEQVPQMAKQDPQYLTVTMNGVRTKGAVADVLAYICQKEAAWCEPEVIKAVAVSAHSWILCRQNAGVEAPEVTGLMPNAAVREAVAEVADLVVTADGETPAFTPWFSMAAAGTNPSVNAFGVERAYLAAKPSVYEQSRDDWQAVQSFSSEVFRETLAARLGATAEDIGDDPSAWVTDVEHDDSGYVTSLKVFGKRVSGMDFWHEYFTRDGEPLLASPAFEVAFSGDVFDITTYGRGHGCGLSMAGATGYANGGLGYVEILQAYFPETTLMGWMEAASA